MAYDLTTGQRTFYLGISGTPGGDLTGVSSIPFVDSAGNTIRCNYIRTSVGLGLTAATKGLMYAVEVSGPPHKGDMVNSELSAGGPGVDLIATSGICGWGGVCTGAQTDSYEWHGSNNQVATGIKFQWQQASPGVSQSVILGVTYGTLYPFSILRLRDSYDAGL